jgi:hypothetical protein
MAGSGIRENSQYTQPPGTWETVKQSAIKPATMRNHEDSTSKTQIHGVFNHEPNEHEP